MATMYMVKKYCNKVRVELNKFTFKQQIKLWMYSTTIIFNECNVICEWIACITVNIQIN